MNKEYQTIWCEKTGSYVSSKNQHILLVSNNKNVTVELADYLIYEGYQVSRALNNTKAYECATNQTPNLILLDFNMIDNHNKFELFDILRSSLLTKNIPIIILGKSADLSTRLYALQHGASDFIYGQYTEEEIAARIKIHLLYSKQKMYMVLRSHNENSEAIINRVKLYLSENLHNPPTLDVLSEELGVHKKKLARVFQKYMNQTIYEYLGKLRLGYSQVLLKETKLSITDIAVEIGFGSLSAFTSAFRKRFGISPSEFRKKLH